MAAIGVAAFAAEHGIGVLNVVNLPYPWAVVLSMLALDFAVYLQHLMFHAVPMLWRLHRVHHADLDFDVTTGARFHPLEILLSMLIKFAVIVVLGAPAVAVLLFEILLNATSLVTHGNVRLPAPIDRVLRWLVVTPEAGSRRTSAKIFCVSGCFSSRWRKRKIVLSSGLASSASSIPAKRRIGSMS